jgi:hypothetical protein
MSGHAVAFGNVLFGQFRIELVKKFVAVFGLRRAARAPLFAISGIPSSVADRDAKAVGVADGLAVA